MKTKLLFAFCLAGCLAIAQNFTNNNGTAVGGATLMGGTSSGDNLNIQSTSDATKGLVTVGSNTFAVFDEINKSVGINCIPATDYLLDISANDNDTRGLRVANSNNGYYAVTQVAAVNDQGKGVFLVADGSQYAAYGPSDLAISGNGFVACTSTNSFVIDNFNAIPMIFAIGGHSASNEKMRIDANGYVGINQTAPAYPLDVVTSATANIGINVYGQVQAYGFPTASDRRFKKNIHKLESVNDKLARLNGYTYDMNREDFKERNFPKEQQIGFIAQELKEVFPQLVSEDKNGYLAVNYQGMVPVLLEAVKAQQKQIEAQQLQISELKQLLTAGNPNANAAVSNNQSVSLKNADVVVLNQNQPNPFAEQTTISYIIPQDAKTARLLFYDANGRMIESVDISARGSGQLNVYASDLSNGTYSYTLIVDGKIVSTKKMIRQ